MELLVPTAGPITTTSPHPYHRPTADPLFITISYLSFKFKNTYGVISSNSFPRLITATSRTSISARASLLESATSLAPAAYGTSPSTRWMVVMEKPPNVETSTRAEVIDYYVQTLARVLPSEKEAQMCIYRASWQTDFFFCCDIDDDTSRDLASIPGVMYVRPDRDMGTIIMDNSSSNLLLEKQSSSDTHASRFSPSVGNSDYWLVKMEKPGVEVVTKAQMVDYFAQTLTKVMGNEKDAQVSIYNISWEKDFGFCCQIDKECAHELSGVPGVLSVQPDVNFESENKNYKEDDMPLKREDSPITSSLPEVKTKRLFVTGAKYLVKITIESSGMLALQPTSLRGLSFYTSEKTLRAAFEPFGKLVEVKIIMDKISKRSKGYAFIEYTTEEAAGAALKEMNGKIINGWMIVVDVAKTNPPKYSRGRPQPPSSSPFS